MLRKACFGGELIVEEPFGRGTLKYWLRIEVGLKITILQLGYKVKKPKIYLSIKIVSFRLSL